ncbi:MAG TPA: hypothetical protein VF641_04770, partial [Methylobacterium sp.]
LGDEGEDLFAAGKGGFARMRIDTFGQGYARCAVIGAQWPLDRRAPDDLKMGSIPLRGTVP